MLESRRVASLELAGGFVADAVSGISIAEESGREQAIARAPTGVTAFVGRALRGPVNRATLLRSFAEYQQIFGGLWQPSTLSYAVEQYFENGGRIACIVRAANGGRPPTIVLPCGRETLRLVGLCPGTREFLRASIDYDGIGVNEPDRFNLVVQRVRAAHSELIEDQEIFRRLSVAPDSGRHVADVLVESRLVRVSGSAPAQRPDRTLSPTGVIAGYVASNPDGDDGAPLTDYDIIGSEVDGTGLFALDGLDGFNLLCIPPLARDRDLSLSTLLVAARFCRDRHAMLVVDPPADWDSPQKALAKLRAWPFRCDNAVMYFPRVLAFDRLRGRYESFGSCAAAAGMIARSDETAPVWGASENEDLLLRPGLRPEHAVSDAERLRLASAGINTLVGVRSTLRPAPSARTLADGPAGGSDWKYLGARRLAFFLMSSIERGTRWMMFERNAEPAWTHARAQVEAFLAALDQEGAFAGRTPDESYFVICDERLNGPTEQAQGKVNVLFGFAATRPDDFHACLVTHRAGRSTARAVSVNRLATSGRRVEEEIETGILRGLAQQP